jgi:hypothetical protein
MACSESVTHDRYKQKPEPDRKASAVVPGSGVTLVTLLPWIIGTAVFLLVMPMIFTDQFGAHHHEPDGDHHRLCAGYNMLLGQGGMLSFGHAVYMGVGGFFCVHIMNWDQFFFRPAAADPAGLWRAVRHGAGADRRRVLDPQGRRRIRDDLARCGRADRGQFGDHRRVFRRRGRHQRATGPTGCPSSASSSFADRGLLPYRLLARSVGGC